MTTIEDAGRPARPHTRFALPAELAATGPAEHRGLARDAVRLLATVDDRIEHARFADLGRFLRPGDLLVVNTSATRAGAVDGVHPRLGPVVVHFSTRADGGRWVVELRTSPNAAATVRTAEPADTVRLPGGVEIILTERYPAPPSTGPRLGPVPTRLWTTQPLPDRLIPGLLAGHGRPIRYGYLSQPWPLSDYQTVFADLAADRRSAEMASAGRPFSLELVRHLEGHGVRFASIALHAGVSSPESGEPPLAERFQVSAATADLVNQQLAERGRVIAVGTTVTRALESAATPDGAVHPAEGWTDLVLGPDRPARVVDGLITGLHDPDASHLLLLEAVVGPARIQAAYDAALQHRYLWHEFGDSCLLLR
jgi:S-adenosylmethionine:tRNA ribosyltransferase-isomerase